MLVGAGRLKVNKVPEAMVSCSMHSNVLFFPQVENERHTNKRHINERYKREIYNFLLDYDITILIRINCPDETLCKQKENVTLTRDYFVIIF